MAGWIPLEKRLLTDPRFLRLVALYLDAHDLDPDSSRNSVTGVTHVLGMLATLWLHADTHIDEHDRLRDQTHEINRMVGWELFCESMPVDWLVDHGCDGVELPNYQEHTGCIAQKRLLAQRRKARSRTTVTNEMSRTTVTDVTHRGPRPDQTRPSKERVATQPKESARIHREQALQAARSTPGLNLAAFDNWLDYRAHVRRKPVSTQALPRTATDMVALGDPQAQSTAVRHAMTCDWSSFYPMRGTAPARPRLTQESALAAIDAAAALTRQPVVDDETT